MSTRLYLAYGSNLCKAAMRRRCPGARASGLVRLNDMRLIFRGVADVVPAPGYAVTCGLWKISAADEHYLDQFEGVHLKRYKKRRARINRTGDLALIYINTARGIYPPTEAYVETIRRGYKDFGINMAELDAAIEYSVTGKDPCQDTMARRARQLAGGDSKLVRLPRKLRCSDCGTVEEVIGRHERAYASNFICSICRSERSKWNRRA